MRIHLVETLRSKGKVNSTVRINGVNVGFIDVQPWEFETLYDLLAAGVQERNKNQDEHHTLTYSQGGHDDVYGQHEEESE